MPPRSLFALAEAVAIKHVDYLYDIGNILTWRQVSGVISKIKDPDQLHLIEEASPHLRGETAELWKDFIQRDYRLLAQSKKYRPSDPADWWKVYYRYKKEDDEQKAAALAKFKGDMDKIKKDKETHRTSMMGMRNAPRIVHSTWWGNRPAPKYFGKTQSEIALAKAIRAGRQVARANRVSSRPFGPSSNMDGRILDPRKQVTRAPAAMIQDHEIAQKPPRPLVQAPRRMNNINHATGGIRRTVDPEAAAREERLKRIKEGKQPVTLSAEALDRDVKDLLGDGAGGRATPPKKVVAPTPSARPVLPGRGGLASLLGSGSSTTGKITRIPMKTTSPPSKNEKQHRLNTHPPAKAINDIAHIDMPSPVTPVQNKVVHQHLAKKPSGSGTNPLLSGSSTNKRKQDPRAALMPIKRRKV